ncbi:MAG: hypothetical protein ACP5MD_00815 [Verrucomicrobiia bacterium]
MSQPDRRLLDEVVFEVLGLTAGEREAACPDAAGWWGWSAPASKKPKACEEEK